MCESFLAILISTISLKTNTKFVMRSIKLMLDYLRNDPNVFRVFKPNKPLLRKMDMSLHIMS